MNHGASLIHNGRSIPLSSHQLTIGRHPQNNLYLEDTAVSRQHAVIAYQNGRWILYDQKSSYGTYVNGRRISSHALQPGDQIRIGSAKLVFQGHRQAGQRWEQQTHYGPARSVFGKGSGFNLQHFWYSLTQGRKFSVSGALLVLLCFILPWTRLSCAGQVQELSGYRLASGTGVQGGLTYLWLIPIAAIAIIVLIYLRYSGQRQGSQATSRWELIASGAGLLVALWLVMSSLSEAEQMGIEVTLLLGYWGTLIGFLLAIWGSYRDYQDSG